MCLELLDYGADSPQVAMNASGDAFAVWVQADVNFSGIHARRYVPGCGWTDAKIIGWGSGTVRYPQVVADNGGSAVAV